MTHLDKPALKRKLKEKAGLVCERHIFLCLGPNCEPEIGKKTWRLLRKRFKELASEGRYFNCTELRCCSLCRSGPIAIVYPEGVYYSEVTPERCERIIDEHLVNGKVVEEFAFAKVPLLQIETPPAAETKNKAKKAV